MTAPKILIIEDNATTRKLLRVTLETEQYEVLEAADGKAALEQAKKNPVLILQDLILPDIDGLTLNHKLRQMPGIKDIPILALSGFLSNVEESHVSDAGFTAFLVKPIEPSHLLEVVQAYLPSISNLDPRIKAVQNKCILLVDDNIAQIKFVKLQLINIGYKVISATNAKEALEKIEKYSPDVVISDVLMPHVDGFELCLAIRRNPKTVNLPVILVTANYLEPADRELAKKVAANDYITRTSNIKELAQALERTFNSQPPLFYPEPIDFFKEEHTHRLIRQLERQTVNNTGLVQQCALQAAQLSLLSGVADALTSSTRIEHTLFNVLTTCLDVAGISKGALYLLDQDNHFQLCHTVGYKKEDQNRLQHFFNLQYAFSEILNEKTVFQISSETLDKKVAQDFLNQAGVTSALLIPLVSSGKCLGALFIGSINTNLTESGPISFAYTLGTQLGQAIALTTAFEKMYESEQRYRNLMDHASCILITTNLQGEIIEINKRGKLLLNRDDENILGKKFIDFVVVADRLYAATQLTKLLQEKVIKSTEVRIQSDNEIQRCIEFNGVEVNIAKEQLLLLIANDVTERNQLRTQALLNDKLTTVGTLTASIVHEINNPIASILANLNFLNGQSTLLNEFFVELHQVSQETDVNKKSEGLARLLKKQEREPFFTKFNEVIQDMTQAADHMHDILRDLKGFARTDNNKIVPVDINEKLNTAVKMALPIIRSHAIVEMNLSDKIPPLLLNSGKLHQVFLNLIVNAAQAIPEGQASNNKIIISTQLEKQSVLITVSDSGVGIAPELLSKIFDPFFTTKTENSGTGLGLTISREIVDGFGGHMEVESVPGRGTVFSIYLPLQLQPTVTIKKEATNAVDKKRRQILLIDDEPLLLKSMQRILELYHDITAVAGGRAALDMITKPNFKFDIIICDLNMPEINGADIYHYIAKHYPGREKDIIFISGGVYTQSLMDFMATIENKHLVKPFLSKVLLNIIDSVHDKI